MAKTVWDVYKALSKYEGNPNANKEVLATIRAHGHHPKDDAAWCTMTWMAALFDAGAIDCIGGYSQISKDARKKAQAAGIWHNGTSGILPMYPVIYGDKNGVPNHSEISIGANLNISGNYEKACKRRTRTGRRIVGFIAPKYKACPSFDNLQITVLAAETMLGTFGSGATREKMLSVFGAVNAAKIQAEVDRVWYTDGAVFDLAVYVLQGFAGKDDYRKKRLGKWYDKVQAKIESINALRGKSIEQVVQCVMDDKFGKEAVRKALLTWCGYNAEKVQAEVNKASEKRTGGFKRVRLYAPKFWENDPDKYGDESIFLQYADDDKTVEKCAVFDTGMKGTLGVKKLQGLNVKKVEGLFITHYHSDHYGLYQAFISAFDVKNVYIPDPANLRKYQKEYYERGQKIIEYCNSKKVPVHLLKKGDVITIGNMQVKCIFQANPDKLPEKDTHHFINNMSMAYRVTVGKWRILVCGDLSADAWRQMLADGVDVVCDILKATFHSDRSGIIEAAAKAIKALLVYTQYHGKERKSNGRKATHDLFRKYGAFVARVYEDGEINIDLLENTATLITSSGIWKVWRK